ncbi:hypothetical protein G6F43_012604 [Rhizopus delemar]|nr:hypothetical protein G6F43_012604 [Rhizopus delemar]
MATHLQQVFSGSNLPATRLNPPSIPTGPHNIGLDGCPFDEVSTHLYMFKKLARRKAPGSDHIRTEMLLPIAKDLIPPLTLLFKLCWRWSSVPRAWCTAQVIPIYKKGDPLDPGNFRPISLTSVFRKLLELCIQDTLVSTAPPLDMVQGGFRRNRSTLDQVLCLHELCRQHSEDHYGEAPVLAFLDIKSAYDTVDRAIIWRALETYVSSPMLGLLQSLFDQVSIEVLLSGYSSPAFWPRTGVLQGSILSPFLYSIYINSLPSALRSIRMPLTQRVYDSMPRREFSNLWINCLLYADDVVIIAAPEVMPRLLRKAESHSRELGYRWNPAKCVIVNSPTAHGAPPLRLYGNPLPIETTFNYLGIPINIKGMISTDLLIARNAKSALAAMRGSLCPLGLRSSAFSRLTASRLYATFIRPKFEYGLCICLFTVKQLELLDKAQDQCLRLAFGGHQKASTAVFKHLTFLPHMHERVHTLRLKYLVRALNLPPDTLLSHILSFVSNAPLSRQFRWPKLLRSNPIWNDSEFNGTSSTIETRLTYFNKKSHLKNSILKYRSNKLQKIRHSQSRPVLLLACRPSLGVDPILFVPMSNHERSRIRRWRMGWLPGRPIPCRCGAPHASRRHLLFCLSASRRLVGASPGNNNPLDFVLNLIPRKPPSSSTINSYSVTRWSTWWPALSSLLLEIDIICHPDEEFTGDSLDVSGSIFLTWLHSASSS